MCRGIDRILQSGPGRFHHLAGEHLEEQFLQEQPAVAVGALQGGDLVGGEVRRYGQVALSADADSQRSPVAAGRDATGLLGFYVRHHFDDMP